MRQFVLSIIALVLMMLDLHACTVCESDNSLQVRSALFGEDFLRNLTFTLAPLAPLLAAVLLIIRKPRTSRKERVSI